MNDIDQGPPARPPAWRWLSFVASLLFGLLLLGWLVRGLDPARLAELVNVRWRWVVLLLFCTAGMALAVAARWRLIVRGLGAPVLPSPLALASYFMLGRILSYAAPKDVADVAVRSLALRMQAAYPFRRGLASVLLDRVFDVIVIFAFLVPAVVTLILHPVGMAAAACWLLPPAAILLSAGLLQHRALVLVIRAANRALSVLARIPLIGQRARQLELPPDAIAFLREPSNAAALLGASLLKFAMNALRFVCVALALPVDIGVIQTLTALPVAQGAFLLLGFTPAALGILEGGWAAGLALQGISATDAALFLLAQRIYVMFAVFVVTPLLFAARAIKGPPTAPGTAPRM